MDVYLPGARDPDARLPAVVFVHGGPIPEDFPVEEMDMDQYTSYGRLVASSASSTIVQSRAAELRTL